MLRPRLAGGERVSLASSRGAAGGSRDPVGAPWRRHGAALGAQMRDRDQRQPVLVHVGVDRVASSRDWRASGGSSGEQPLDVRERLRQAAARLLPRGEEARVPADDVPAQTVLEWFTTRSRAASVAVVTSFERDWAWSSSAGRTSLTSASVKVPATSIESTALPIRTRLSRGSERSAATAAGESLERTGRGLAASVSARPAAHRRGTPARPARTASSGTRSRRRRRRPDVAVGRERRDDDDGGLLERRLAAQRARARVRPLRPASSRRGARGRARTRVDELDRLRDVGGLGERVPLPERDAHQLAQARLVVADQDRRGGHRVRPPA